MFLSSDVADKHGIDNFMFYRLLFYHVLSIIHCWYGILQYTSYIYILFTMACTHFPCICVIWINTLETLWSMGRSESQAHSFSCLGLVRRRIRAPWLQIGYSLITFNCFELAAARKTKLSYTSAARLWTGVCLSLGRQQMAQLAAFTTKMMKMRMMMTKPLGITPLFTFQTFIIHLFTFQVIRTYLFNRFQTLSSWSWMLAFQGLHCLRNIHMCWTDLFGKFSTEQS